MILTNLKFVVILLAVRDFYRLEEIFTEMNSVTSIYITNVKWKKPYILYSSLKLETVSSMEKILKTGQDVWP